MAGEVHSARRERSTARRHLAGHRPFQLGRKKRWTWRAGQVRDAVVGDGHVVRRYSATRDSVACRCRQFKFTWSERAERRRAAVGGATSSEVLRRRSPSGDDDLEPYRPVSDRHHSRLVGRHLGRPGRRVARRPDTDRPGRSDGRPGSAPSCPRPATPTCRRLPGNGSASTRPRRKSLCVSTSGLSTGLSPKPRRNDCANDFYEAIQEGSAGQWTGRWPRFRPWPSAGTHHLGLTRR